MLDRFKEEGRKNGFSGSMCKDIIMNGPVRFNEFHCSSEFLQRPEHYMLGYVECQVSHYLWAPLLLLFTFIL